MAQRFIEPSLRDLLDDPLTAIIMARDGVSRTALTELLATVAAGLALRQNLCAACLGIFDAEPQ